jgi:lactoylglutathione lyase
MKLPPSTSTISTRGSQISYENVQFTKAPTVLRGMGLAHLPKNEKAIKELTGKGMAPG